MGKPVWTNPYTEEEIIEQWSRNYQASLPPIQETMFPIKMTDMQSENESNRWQVIGGPMDGWGLCKLLVVKKGRGKNQVEVQIPINPESFMIKINGETEMYEFDGERYKY